MYLQFYINDNGDKVYTTKQTANSHKLSMAVINFIPQHLWLLRHSSTLPDRLQVCWKHPVLMPCWELFCANCKESPTGMPAQSAHPARFSPDDKYSRQRVLLKKRFGLLPTQKPPPKY